LNSPQLSQNKSKALYVETCSQCAETNAIQSWRERWANHKLQYSSYCQ